MLRQRFAIFVLSFICIFIFLFPDLLPQPMINFRRRKVAFFNKRNKNSSSKCVVHPPDPWDRSILEYVLDDLQKPAELACQDARVQPELTFLDSSGVLHLNESGLAASALQVECQFRSFDKTNGDDETLTYSQWTPFNTSVKIDEEFIEVSCQRTWFPRTRIYSNNHNQIKALPVTEPTNSRPSVVIIVLDSVSHSNFRRTMNKTLSVLSSHYSSFIFDGMTKVGDNSYSNAVGFLAGQWWSTEFGDAHGYFDDHDLIWKRFKHHGYRTLYAEDYPGFNLFNYLSKGFHQKPVDHYFRPFWLNVYWSYVHRRSKNLCYGNNKMHNLQLNYLSQFLEKYKNQPKFAVSWFTELGHDWLNQVRYGDEELANFLKDHVEELEESFLFVMSDHGHRFDNIRKTFVGRQEERLPFFSMSLPRSLRSENQLLETMRNNTQKLASFFDVYATFRHILTYPEIPKDLIRGTSLLTPVQVTLVSDYLCQVSQFQDRSCESAHIPEEFCVCEPEVPVKVTDSLIGTIALDLADHINHLLEPYEQCTQLKLVKVVAATSVGDDDDDVVDGQRFRVTIEMSPSAAVFEALLSHDEWSSQSTVIGDIHRINKYGSQSLCVEDQFLRKLCFCSTFLEVIPIKGE